MNTHDPSDKLLFSHLQMVRDPDQECWLYLYLLLEFQSGVDSFMAVRVLTCVDLLYQDLVLPQSTGLGFLSAW